MINAIFGALLLTSASGAELRSAPGKKIADHYIVRLHESETVADMKAHIAHMQGEFHADMELQNMYTNIHHGLGYSARLGPNALAKLMKEDIVNYIEEDQVVDLNDCQKESNPDWGLARVNHRNYTKETTYTYDYTTGKSGANVDAYIIDTGIYCENLEFVNKKTGTCTFGATFTVPKDETDGNGHGTHCAGTVGGITYGVAKEANLIAVKVLSDRGSGSTSGVIGGIDWVAGQAPTTGRKSVANLSLGGGFSQTQNDAIESLVAAGVSVAVAAGNDNSDACNYSPASAPSAITVAASDDQDRRASYSNYGDCCDIFGPGSSITSAWIGSPSATNTISGTSMASPHICGVAANYFSADPSLTPATVTQKMLADASAGEITDVKGTANLVAYTYCS
jgi:aqualysin 1